MDTTKVQLDDPMSFIGTTCEIIIHEWELSTATEMT